MANIKQEDFIQSVADALQYISLLPPGRLHQEPRRRLRARGIAGGQGCDRADPDQFAHVRRRPSADLPGHRHRHRVPRRSAWTCAGTTPTMGVEDMVNEGVRRAYNHPDNKLRAIGAGRSGRQAHQHQGQHAGGGQHEGRARRTRRRDRRGEGRRLGGQVEVRDAQSVRLDRRLGAEDRADHGRRLVPAGHARHRHRRHRREGDAAGEGSADGADRHHRPAGARRRPIAPRNCGWSCSTRSTRSASARRDWAA